MLAWDVSNGVSPTYCIVLLPGNIDSFKYLAKIHYKFQEMTKVYSSKSDYYYTLLKALQAKSANVFKRKTLKGGKC